MSTKEITKGIGTIVPLQRAMKEKQKEAEKCPYCGSVVIGRIWSPQKYAYNIQQNVYHCKGCGRIILLPVTQG